MRKLSEKEQKLTDWCNELIYDSTDYSDIKVINIAQNAIEFAYDNLKEKECIYEGYLYQYEVNIGNIALAIESHLQKNARNKKSSNIKQFVSDIIYNEKYGRGRSDYIFLLSVLKMDEELRSIATERTDFWETPRMQFQLMHALFKRKISGFAKEAEMLIVNNPKEIELKKYAKKYIEKYGFDKADGE